MKKVKMMMTAMLMMALMTTPVTANSKVQVNHQQRNEAKANTPQNAKDKNLDGKVESKDKNHVGKVESKAKKQDGKAVVKENKKSFWSFSFKPSGKNVTQRTAVAAAKRLNGVQKATWNDKTKKLTVVYDSRVVSTAQIKAAVNKAHR